MENYQKGKNQEEPVDKSTIPIPNLPKDFLLMQIRGGSKIRNVLEYALNHFEEYKTIVWTGTGTSVGKTITCAEIMKREYKNRLYQVTKICYHNVDEYWDPLLPELEKLIVKRKLPMIHICLSLEKLNEKEPGYQAPGTTIPFRSQKVSPLHRNSEHNNNKNQQQKKANVEQSR